MMILGTFGILFAASTAVPQAPASSRDPDLVETAVRAGSFETLIAAAGAAGLVDALQGEGPFTVFAPTDDAFGALPDGTVESLLRPESRRRLERILRYHVVPGRISAADAAAAGSATTLTGASLEIRVVDGLLRVGTATVTANDIAARNGIIHVIDSVLIPEEAAPAEAPNPGADVEGLILRAIERGVPLFNDGQIRACADIYEIVTLSVLALAASDLPEPAVDSLHGGLLSAGKTDDAREKAWQLRYGMDGALLALRQGSMKKPDTNESRPAKQLTGAGANPGETVFGFDGEDRAEWFVLNDDVMGGDSTSRVATTNSGTLLFEGQLSLENNGGFASVRSEDYRMGLDGIDAFKIRVRGDGRSYKFGVRAGSGWDAGAWRTEFDTVAGEWTELTIPVAELRYNFRGRQIDRGEVDPSRIRGFSLLISDKNDREPFRLEVDWIRAIRADG